MLIVGVSSCLLGNEVRFDGGHQYHPFINNELSDLLTFQVICPEVGIGMGVPRPPIELVQASDGKIRVVEVNNRSQDYTRALSAYAQLMAKARLADISGYIFKKGSPSCGIKHVKVYDSKRQLVHQNGIGLFADAIQKLFPLMPAVDEADLDETRSRKRFLQQVQEYHAWQKAQD